MLPGYRQKTANQYPVPLSLYLSFNKTICQNFQIGTFHIRMKLFSGMVTAKMMNDMRTKADRCDKYNVEWLINLMWVRKWKKNSSRDLLV